jgi:hypothetical protein
MPLERLEPRLALANHSITRPMLEQASTLVMDSSMGPNPVVMSKAQVVGNDVKSFVISHVAEGSVVEKWDAIKEQWVDVSTMPTSSNSQELMQLLSNRFIQEGDKIQWRPKAGVAAAAQQAFEMIGWDDGTEPPGVSDEPPGVSDDAPSSVQNLAVTPTGVAELTVSWNAPATGEVTSYSVTTTSFGNAGTTTQTTVTTETSLIIFVPNIYNVYTVQVTASNAAGNASEQASLAVNDLDEVAPMITSGATAAAIDENSGAGQVVYTATSTDSSDVSDGVTYHLDTTVGDHAAFTIDRVTGEVSLTANPDYETKASYSFTIIARDTAGLEDRQVVALAIIDGDDSAPIFDSGDTASSVDENVAVGHAVYTANANDAQSVTYALKTVDDSDRFAIDSSTGVVTLAESPDHETKSIYQFTVLATDPDNHVSEQPVTLVINDLDDLAPVFDDGSSTTLNVVTENSGAGQVIYTPTVSDSGDVSDGVTFSLKDVNDDDAFTIDASTGAITLVADPDYETQTSYSFTVVATDAAGNFSEQQVTLPVGDLDDTSSADTTAPNAPTLTQTSSTLTAVGEAGATLAIFNGTTDITARFTITENNGTYTATANPEQFSGSESLSLTARLTDASGNVSDNSNAVTGHIDTDPGTLAGAYTQAAFRGVESIIIDERFSRLKPDTETELLGKDVYGFAATGDNATALLTMQTGRSDLPSAGLFAIGQTASGVTVGTMAQDPLFADLLGLDPTQDGAARLFHNFMGLLSNEDHHLDSGDPLSVLALGSADYLPVLDSNAQDGVMEDAHNIRVDSFNSQTLGLLDTHVDELLGTSNRWATDYNVVLVRPAIGEATLNKILAWAEATGGGVLFMFDTRANRPEVVTPSDSTKSFLDSVGITATEGRFKIAFDDYSPTRIDPYTRDHAIGQLDMFVGGRGESASEPLVLTSSLSLPSSLLDANGLEFATVTWASADTSYLSNSGTLVGTGPVSLTATVAFKDGTTEIIDHYFDVVQLVDGDGNSRTQGLTFEFVDWVDDSSTNADGVTRDFNRVDLAYKDENDIFDIKSIGNHSEFLVDSVVSSELYLDDGGKLLSKGGIDPDRYTNLRDNLTIGSSKHLAVVSGYLIAEDSGTYDLQLAALKNSSALFIETDDGTRSLFSNPSVANGQILEDLALTSGQAYRVTAIFRDQGNSSYFELSWKSPADTSFVAVPADNLAARPSVYPVAGRGDGNFFDYIDFDFDPVVTLTGNTLSVTSNLIDGTDFSDWALSVFDGTTDVTGKFTVTEARGLFTAEAITGEFDGSEVSLTVKLTKGGNVYTSPEITTGFIDTTAGVTATSALDVVWQDRSYLESLPDLDPVATRQSLYLDEEYFQGDVKNLILTDEVISEAVAVSLNAYSATDSSHVGGLYHWELDTSSTITMQNFASQLQAKLRSELSNNGLTVSANNGVIEINDPSSSLVFEEFLVSKEAAIQPLTLDLTQDQAGVNAQSGVFRVAAGYSADIPNNPEATGATYGTPNGFSRLTFVAGSIELNNVKVKYKHTERELEQWAEAIEDTLAYYLGDGEVSVTYNATTETLEYADANGNSITPTTVELHSDSVFGDLLQDVTESGLRSSSISLGDISGVVDYADSGLSTTSDNAFSVLEQPVFGDVTIDADGTYHYRPTDARFQGFDQFHIQVVDVLGQSHTVAVTIGNNAQLNVEESEQHTIALDEPTYVAPTVDYTASETPSDLVVADVFLAQLAVQRPDSPYLHLVEDRWFKLKLNVTSESEAAAPVFEVQVRDLDGNVVGTRVLDGPSNLPQAGDLDLPSLSNLATDVGQTDSDSYTVVIPSEWVKPGVTFEILTNGQSLSLPEAYVNPDGYLEPNVVGGGSPDLTIGHYTLGADRDSYLYEGSFEFAEEILSRIPATEIDFVSRSGSTLIETIRAASGGISSPLIVSADMSLAAGAATYLELVENPFGAGLAGWGKNYAADLKKANFLSPFPGNVNYPDYIYSALNPDVGGGVGAGQTGAGNTAITATIHEFLGHGSGIGHPSEVGTRFAYNYYQRVDPGINAEQLNQKANILGSTTINDGTNDVTVDVVQITEESVEFEYSGGNSVSPGIYAFLPDPGNDGDYIAVEGSWDNGSFTAGDRANDINLSSKIVEAVYKFTEDLRYVITDTDTGDLYFKNANLGENWYYDQRSDNYISNFYISNMKEIFEAAVQNAPADADGNKIGPGLAIDTPVIGQEGPILNIDEVIAISGIAPVYELRTGPMAGSNGKGSVGRYDDSGLQISPFSDLETYEFLFERFSNMVRWTENAIEGQDIEDGGYAGDGYHSLFALPQDVYLVEDFTGVRGDTRLIVGVKNTDTNETNAEIFYSADGRNQLTVTEDGSSSFATLGDGIASQNGVFIKYRNTLDSVIDFEVKLDDGSTHDVRLAKDWQIITADNRFGTVESLLPHQVGVDVYNVYFSLLTPDGDNAVPGLAYHNDIPITVWKTIGSLPAPYYDFLNPSNGIEFDFEAQYALRVTYQTDTGLITDHLQIPNGRTALNLPIKGELVRIDLLEAEAGKVSYLENKVVTSFVNAESLANIVFGGNEWFGVIDSVELPDYYNGHEITWTSSSDFVDLNTGAVDISRLQADSTMVARWTEGGENKSLTLNVAAVSDEILEAALFGLGDTWVSDASLPTELYGYTVEWSSADPSVISNDGAVTTSSSGNTTLTAMLKNSSGSPVRSISQAVTAYAGGSLDQGLQLNVYDLSDLSNLSDQGANLEKDEYLDVLVRNLDFDNSKSLWNGAVQSINWASQDARSWSHYNDSLSTMFGIDSTDTAAEANFLSFVDATYEGNDGDLTNGVEGHINKNALMVFSGFLRPDTTAGYDFMLDVNPEGMFIIEVDGELIQLRSTARDQDTPQALDLQAGENYKIWAVYWQASEDDATNQSDFFYDNRLKWKTEGQDDDAYTAVPESNFYHRDSIDLMSADNRPFGSSASIRVADI